MIVAAIGAQGIGLRPHPWALFSRPVGPERTAVSSVISSCERKPRRRPRPPLRPRADRVEGAPAKRKLLAKRIRGEAGSGGTKALPEPPG